MQFQDTLTRLDGNRFAVVDGLDIAIIAVGILRLVLAWVWSIATSAAAASTPVIHPYAARSTASAAFFPFSHFHGV
jgi:hypothetical protein